MEATKVTDFAVKDSGVRESFESGAVRDTEAGKPRYDLIPDELLDFLAYEYAKQDPMLRYDLIPTALLTRLAVHMAKGAKKYTDRNWEKGMPKARLISSAFRHLVAWKRGKLDEDHGSGVLFNIGAAMHFEAKNYPMMAAGGPQDGDCIACPDPRNYKVPEPAPRMPEVAPVCRICHDPLELSPARRGWVCFRRGCPMEVQHESR